MQICKELGLTLTQGMELSVFEIKLWLAFFKTEAKLREEAGQKIRRS
jgi:hypothetical protein